MSDALAQAIENIRNDPNVGGYDEASVRQGVVLRTLAVLGWDPFDLSEVTPNFAVGGGRADYCLRIGGQSKIVVEVKRGGEDLAAHQSRLVGYSSAGGVGLAALANGLEWRFYLPLREGASDNRMFAAVNVASDANAAVDVLSNVLSKDAVASGSAAQYAETLLQRQLHAKIVSETLPAAWNSLMSDPDDALIELLANKVKAISGAVPSASQVRSFLLAAGGTGAPPSGNGERRQRTQTRNRQNRTAIRRSPAQPTRGFRFLGEMRRASSWVENMQKFAEIMHERHAAEFGQKVAPIRGHSRVYYSRSDARMTAPKPIGTSGWFVETNFGAKSARELCIRLATAFGYNESDIEFL